MWAGQALGAMVMFAAIVAAANDVTARYRLVPVGFGLTATAGTYAIGFCLLARDWVHDTAGPAAVSAAIVAGTVSCAVTAGPRIAVAPMIAYLLSEVVDLLVYQRLRGSGFIRAALVSNAAGATIATGLLHALAGYPTWAAVPGQLVAQATATAIPIVVLLTARARLHHRHRHRHRDSS